LAGPVVIDLSAVTLSSQGIAISSRSCRARHRVMGLEATDAANLAPGLPPVLRGGRAVSNIEAIEPVREKPSLRPRSHRRNPRSRLP